MGLLEFIASIIGSLAWPGVVLVVLWYNRKRLANLPDWLEELTLPGGAKIKFVRALEKARAQKPTCLPLISALKPPPRRRATLTNFQKQRSSRVL